MSYDPACRRLATHFLSDYTLNQAEREQETESLAQAIQRTVEDELLALEHRKR